MEPPTPGPVAPVRTPHTHPVVIHLLERLIADGALKDDPLERVGFVTGHQLHTDHLSFSHSHVAEHLGQGTKRQGLDHRLPPPTPQPGPTGREGCSENPILQGTASSLSHTPVASCPPRPMGQEQPHTGAGAEQQGRTGTLTETLGLAEDARPHDGSPGPSATVWAPPHCLGCPALPATSLRLLCSQRLSGGGRVTAHLG